VPAIGRVEVVAGTGSTSTDLVRAVAADPGAWPDRSVLVTDHQQAGRGRAGRTWTTPQGAALTFSVLLRPGVRLERFGWVPLLAGVAVVRALADLGVTASVKWPNDVLVSAPDGTALAGWGVQRKVAGVLSELVTTPTGPGVVVGIGVNVSQTADELPVPSATSLRLVGEGQAGRTAGDELAAGDVDRTSLLASLMSHLVHLDDAWRAGDAAVTALCVAACGTIGAAVQVELPGGGHVEGVASGLSAEGALELVDVEGRTVTVLAGDVHHLRPAPGAPEGHGAGSAP
jgi:BirA family biotin operon repressor/biotin-[acetyl-CoA-carboxylase] ligase